MKDNIIESNVKVRKIISAFQKPEPEPKMIAEKIGFENHKDMATYMKNKGYKWDLEENNYIKSINSPAPSINEPEDISSNNSNIDLESIDNYISFLKFLYEKKEIIYEVLSRGSNQGQIPRYALPGITRTKAIYMNDTVANLIVEFSKEKNVTQREIVEAALIEYMQNYGYKTEVESILGIG